MIRSEWDQAHSLAQLCALAGAVWPHEYAAVRAKIADKPEDWPEWVLEHPAYVETRKKIREARA